MGGPIYQMERGGATFAVSLDNYLDNRARQSDNWRSVCFRLQVRAIMRGNRLERERMRRMQALAPVRRCSCQTKGAPRA
jgi:hypothetical protein